MVSLQSALENSRCCCKLLLAEETQYARLSAEPSERVNGACNSNYGVLAFPAIYFHALECTEARSCARNARVLLCFCLRIVVVVVDALSNCHIKFPIKSTQVNSVVRERVLFVRCAAALLSHIRGNLGVHTPSTHADSLKYWRDITL